MKQLTVYPDGTTKKELVDEELLAPIPSIETRLQDLDLKKADKPPIPADWEAKVRKFSAMFNNSGEVDSFLFFSDPHYWAFSDPIATMEASLDEMQSVYDRSPLTFCLCGGDWTTNQDTQEEACFKLGNIDGEARSRFGAYVPILGNHDTNYQGTELLTQKAIDNLFFRQEGKAYYRFQTKTTSYYILNSGEDFHDAMTSYNWEQIDWMANGLIKNDDKHNIVAMHMVVTEDASRTPFSLCREVVKIINAYNGRELLTLHNQIYDFSKASGTVHCILGGHNHTSFDGTISGVPYMLVTCVMHGQAMDKTDYGYDLCLLDYRNAAIKTVRIGEGDDREIPIIPTIAPRSEIVTDGLVFHLDGYARGGRPGEWVDSVGGQTFDLKNCTETSSGVVFNGVDSIAVALNQQGFPADGHTIEVVFESEQQSYVGYIAPRMDTGESALMWSDYMGNYYYRSPGAWPGYTSKVSGFRTVSMSIDHGYENKQAMLVAASEEYDPASSADGVFLGNRWREDYPFKGTIFAVRVYDRVLTEKEILQNQTNDMIRYATS